MNFSHLNFGNSFMSMHQFSSATKVVGNVQQNITFIPASSTQHYQNQNNSSHVGFPNNIQVSSALIQHQHHYEDSSPRILHQNVTSHIANTTSTTSTAAQTQWADGLSNVSNENTIKVNLSNFAPQSQGHLITQTIQRPPRTVVMQSVSTMTDNENPIIQEAKTIQKDIVTSEDSDDSSKSSMIGDHTFSKYNCFNNCSKINLKTSAPALAKYLLRLQPSSIPPNIQEFLKMHNIEVNLNKAEPTNFKKDSEDVKTRPGIIRITTALDGSLLYCCSECHMAYSHKELLERHLTVHKAERRFECNVCGVCLKRKEHLDQHKRGHSEERPFVCDICCKGFKRNEHLRRHVVIHSGDKSHVCTQCGKAFSRKDHLNKHLQTHMVKRGKPESREPTIPLHLPTYDSKDLHMYSSKQVLH